jgi:hypothetical protein
VISRTAWAAATPQQPGKVGPGDGACAVTGITRSVELMLSAIPNLARLIVITIGGTIVVMGVQTGFVWLPSGYDLLYEGAVAAIVGLRHALLHTRWNTRTPGRTPNEPTLGALTMNASR